MDEFPSGGGGGSGDDRPDRPRGVNFKKIQELRDSNELKDIKKLGRKTQVLYKKDHRSANELWTTLPSEYLAIFSDRFRSAIWDEGLKSITIVGGDKAVYQQIFDWILDSIHQDTPSAAPTPEYDDSNPTVFRKYATLILAAEHLKIPARDFAHHVIKKTLFKLSREKFMSWDEVDFYIESFQGESDTDEKMREVLTNSIANAWWKRNFRECEEDEDEDDYCILSVLRTEHSWFDEDLHNWCQKNEERIRGKWAEKDAQKAGGGGGFGDAVTSGGGDGDNADTTGGGANWGNDSGVTTDVVGDWNAAKAAGGREDSTIGMEGDSQKENVAPAEAAGWDTSAMPSMAAVGGGGSGGGWDDGGHNGDWADEVNTDQQHAKTSW